MKFKLDEHFGSRTQEIFRAAGHDVTGTTGAAVSKFTFQNVGRKEVVDCRDRPDPYTSDRIGRGLA